MVHIIFSLSCHISILSISASFNLLCHSHFLSPLSILPSIHPSAKPQNSASIVTVEAGTKPVVVARCESADGRPAAEISWVTTANGNATTQSKTAADNTVTLSSEYRMVPTPADNGKDISCVVAHRTQVKPESFQLKLAVQCKTLHPQRSLKTPLIPLLFTFHANKFNSLLFLSPIFLSFIPLRCPPGDNSRL